MNKWTRFLGATLVVLLLFSIAAIAQETGASINGTVHDSTGAVVNNAAVIASNIATNAQTPAQTRSDGEYTLLNLPPGTYKLRVTADGFRSYEQTGILLNLNQHATVDIVLQLGAVQEQVTVNADVSGLDLTSADLNSEVNGASISNLPLNTRESYDLLAMVPGFSGSVGNDYNAVAYSIDGGDNEYGDVLIDGTPAGFPTVQGYQGVGIFPSVDAIGEFRLLSQDFPAEFGRTLDGILNVVFKSGTNQYHGTAFEFIRTKNMDANDFFSNRNGVPLPNFHRDQFGGMLDGPIYRNRTFFLLSTELLRQSTFTSETASVPTLLQRQGDFSQTYGPNGNQVAIYDPFTTTLNPNGSGTYIRSAFPNNKIPSSEMSNVAQKVISYYPLPNAAGNPITNANNYYAVGSQGQQVTSWDVRVDHTINNKSKTFGRYSNRYVWTTPPPLMPASIAIASSYYDSGDTSRGFTLGYTSSLTQRVIFDIRLGFSRTLYDYKNMSIGFDDTTIGLPASIDAAPGNSGIHYFPTISPSGYLSLGQSSNRHNAFQTAALLSSLTLERGRHIFKLGFDGRQIRVNDNETTQTSGNFSFGTNWTQGPNPNVSSTYAGNGFASFLVGMGTGQMYQTFKDVATQSYYMAEYLQDDWHILPKLTLNLGIRYDLDSPRTERFNHQNYFDPTIPAPLASVIPGLTGGLIYVGIDGRSRHQYNVDWNNIAPRVGISYSLRSSTVIHAGGAVVYGASNQAASGDTAPTGWTQLDTWISSLDGITPYHTIDNPFPNGFPVIQPTVTGLNTAVGGPLSGIIQHSPTPYSIQWGLDVQQMLPFNLTADIAYVGNRGRQMITSYESGENWDQLPVKYLSEGSALQASVPNPFYGNPAVTGTLAAATTTAAQLLLEYPQFTSVTVYHLMGGDTQYDSIQLALNKRLSSGIQIQGSYVLAKDFDMGSTHQDSFNPKAEYAISSQDIHQRFVVSYIYQLPIGHGRIWGNMLPKWGNAVIGGWQVNGITTLQGGSPLGVSASNTLSSFNFQTLYANTNFQNPSYSGSVKNRLSKYFNTADFSQPAAFTLGNGRPHYNHLRSPGLDSTDFSLFKEFNPIEKVKAEFRAEAFNIFNHPQFSGPNTSVTSSSFGQITSQANSPRQIQFGLKFLF